MSFILTHPRASHGVCRRADAHDGHLELVASVRGKARWYVSVLEFLAHRWQEIATDFELRSEHEAIPEFSSGALKLEPFFIGVGGYGYGSCDWHADAVPQMMAGVHCLMADMRSCCIPVARALDAAVLSFGAGGSGSQFFSVYFFEEDMHALEAWRALDALSALDKLPAWDPSTDFDVLSTRFSEYIAAFESWLQNYQKVHDLVWRRLMSLGAYRPDQRMHQQARTLQTFPRDKSADKAPGASASASASSEKRGFAPDAEARSECRQKITKVEVAPGPIVIEISDDDIL